MKHEEPLVDSHLVVPFDCCMLIVMNILSNKHLFGFHIGVVEYHGLSFCTQLSEHCV